MIGWRDRDNDGIFDVLDVPLVLDGTGAYDDTAGRYQFDGFSTPGTLRNENRNGLSHAISLNTIDRAFYRVDGGLWIEAATYGTHTATLDLTVGPFEPGGHTVQFMTMNDETGLRSNVFSDTFVVPPADEMSDMPGLFPIEQFPVGTTPKSVAIGDLNGDTVADLVTANSGDNSISVLFGHGNGRFTGAVEYEVGDGPRSVALADLNTDGALDVVIAGAGSDGSVTVLMGNDDGILTPQDPITVVGALDVAVGDVNRDGSLDIVTTTSGPYPDYEGSVSILMGNGDGTFVPGITFDTGPHPVSAALRDLNSDTVLDIVTANQHSTDSDTVSVHLGNMDGSFAAHTTYPIDGTGGNPVYVYASDSLALADLNSDATLDIAVANYRGNVSVLLGKSDGTFAPQSTFQVSGSAHAVAAGDLNADGNTDLIATNNVDDAVSVLFGNGDGTFGPYVSYKAGDAPHSIALGDLNGDSQFDIATTSYYGNEVSVLLRKQNGGFPTTPAAQILFTIGDHFEGLHIQRGRSR